MTFRTRLVMVAAVAVILAVLAACVSSYFAARSSLLDSVDGTLNATATTTLKNLSKPSFVLTPTSLPGLNFQFIGPTGRVLEGGGIPVTSAAKSVASSKARKYLTNVTIRGADYRELVVSAGTVHVRSGREIGYTTPAALQLMLPLASVDSQLSDLGAILSVVAALGIALALVLAWLVGRTALVPLNELTSAVEEVAATTDVSRRLDPGGPDELGRLRRAFNRLLTALENSQAAQRQLVLDAGHELRTPLTSLRTNLEVVRRLDELPAEEREVLVDDLLTQMGELTTLVGDLSELARGEQRHSESEALRLDRLVEDAVALAVTHGRRRGVTFALASNPTWVQVQRDRVERAVGNLLNNALKWSPDSAVVEVGCFSGTVTVRDHGPGIEPDDLPHVFDRFWRAPSARAMPGSGLGLAIVAQVAQAEGGTVTAGVAPGGGAVFQLHLPAVAPPDDTGVAEEDE